MDSKIFLFFILIWLSKGVFSCEIQSPEKIYKDSKTTEYDFKKVLTFNQCNNAQVQKVLTFFSDFQGDLPVRVFESEMNKEITLSNNVHISSLDQAISEKANLEQGHFFREAIFLQGETILSGASSSSLQVDCNTCNKLGEKTVSLKLFDSLTGQYTSRWVRGKLQVKSSALKVKRNLNLRMDKLSISDFEKTDIFTSDPQNYFQNLNQIVFYKLTKNKNKGEPLLQNDLTPLYLVRVGQPVSVSLSHQGVKLQTHAIAAQAGKMGDVIRLKNIKTKKHIIGKVTDFNQVEVDL